MHTPVHHLLHRPQLVGWWDSTAVADLDDPVVGSSSKPLIAWVHCDAPHPTKMAADNLHGACTYTK